jgi:hypothetical protein
MFGKRYWSYVLDERNMIVLQVGRANLVFDRCPALADAEKSPG